MLILFLIFVLFMPASLAITVITGEAITGKATSQPTNVSVAVILALPAITIVHPQNKTYLSKDNFFINVSITNYQSAWYNFNNGANMSLSLGHANDHEAFGNISSGSSTFYVFANISNGSVVSKSVTFSIDLNLFNISYNEFAGQYSGNSTDLFRYSFEEMQNLSNCIFEDIKFGKIFFRETVNLTNDDDHDDGFINIDDYVNISGSRIEIDTRYLPNLNKSATLILYNLTLTNPRILFEGVACPSSICKQNYYTNGELSFNVSHFTVYSAEETSSDVQASPGGSSGGGGGGISAKPGFNAFSINRDNINIHLRLGEIKRQSFTIRNTGSKSLRFNLSMIGLGEFVRFRESDFELKDGESKNLDIDFLAAEDSIPNLYLGKIIVRGGDVEREILVALDITSRKALFDIIVEIPKKFLNIQPGDEIIANIKLFEVEKIGRVDVALEYGIKDKNGNIILFNSETIAVEGQANFVKSLKVPEDLERGNYLFYLRMSYDDEIASGSGWFFVEKKSFFGIVSPFYLIVVVVIFIIMAFVFIEIRKIKKDIKSHYKIDGNLLRKERLIKLKRGE